jgi:molybdopterin biosynthesis enzyme
MKIKKISAGAIGEHNEDLIAVYETGGFTDIVIMDGGTSVADRDFIDSDIGDVVWFARSFSSALAK